MRAYAWRAFVAAAVGERGGMHPVDLLAALGADRRHRAVAERRGIAVIRQGDGEADARPRLRVVDRRLGLVDAAAAEFLGDRVIELARALQIAREPANLATDLIAIGDAFVVVVVGGMGSITGAYLAAVIIAEVKAICIGIGVVDFGFVTVNFSKFTLVAEFLVMAIVLIVKPKGLFGANA